MLRGFRSGLCGYWCTAVQAGRAVRMEAVRRVKVSLTQDTRVGADEMFDSGFCKLETAQATAGITYVWISVHPASPRAHMCRFRVAQTHSTLNV